jgi:glycerol kinase
MVYDSTGQCLTCAARELTPYFPQPGWVEHDPEEIWRSVASVVAEALAAVPSPGQLVAIGITNQRETIIVWDRSTGKPVTRALVWQDRRTSDWCRLHAQDEPWLSQRSGLVLDPYFSATKIAWVLDNVEAGRRRAEAGQLLCGTVDTFLIWRLTGGRLHATDVTNASRTLLLNIDTLHWDEELCRYFAVPTGMLPTIKPSAGDYGRTAGAGFLPDGVAISSAVGDQQAALVGQCGFADGDAKCTYGTGAFFLRHTGSRPVRSGHRLLTTAAATWNESCQYALEGSVFVAGAAIGWLRDGLGLLDTAESSEAMAARSGPTDEIIFVPALVGLGAPHWVPEARGVLFGLTRATSRAELARAALEGVAFQVADLLDAAMDDTGAPLAELRVDGGMAKNAWFLQFQADILGKPVCQAVQTESTAQGAAFLAGIHAGLWSIEQLRQEMARPRRFEPKLTSAARSRRLHQWRRAVRTVVEFYKDQST